MLQDAGRLFVHLQFLVDGDFAKVQLDHAIPLFQLEATAFDLTDTHQPLDTEEIVAKALGVVIQRFGCDDSEHGMALSVGMEFSIL